MALPRGVAVLAAVGALSLVSSPAAHASCASLPTPSAYAFTGTVIDTERGGRVAMVMTDAGKNVTVLGTEASSWLSSSYTSVDRQYAVGGRYEFHPLNRKPPYRDNACTATRQLSGPDPQGSERTGFLPGWSPVDEGRFLIFGSLAAAVLSSWF